MQAERAWAYAMDLKGQLEQQMEAQVGSGRLLGGGKLMLAWGAPESQLRCSRERDLVPAVLHCVSIAT